MKDHRNSIIETVQELLKDFIDDLYDDFQQKDVYTSDECLEVVNTRFNEYINNLNEID